MASNKLLDEIEKFVILKPRSIQEIAQHIRKNWRTANRYVEEIERERGTLSTRTFREGTRGALKIVFNNSPEMKKSSLFQDQIEKQIFSGRTKYDFSPFDIFQHVEEKKKEAKIKIGSDESSLGLQDLKSLLRSAKKQVLIFSGNLSFTNFSDEKDNIFDEMESLFKKGVNQKIVCRVDLDGRENVQRLLSLNYKYGIERIEIKHDVQPLRAIIIDNVLVNLKEVKSPTGRKDELSQNAFIFYTIKDKEWVDWMTSIFWKKFNSNLSAQKRIEQLEGLKFSTI